MIHRILKSDLVYTSIGEPIEDGMIAINPQNEIEAVGQDLNTNGVKVEYFEGFLCPGFINTHCHLELSHLKGKIAKNTSLPGFIQELQSKRTATEKEVEEEIIQADLEMEKEGIVAVGDISNGNSTFETKKSSNIYYHTFIELFGFDPNQAESVIQKGKELKTLAKNEGLGASIIPHSPYSVSKELFQLINLENENQPISIHNQENESENFLFQKGDGAIAEMLKKFGLNLNKFQITKESSLRSYLKHLSSSEKLLLVHNTFTSEEDLLFAENLNPNIYWCFCPKANLYIENRLPEISMFAKAGVKCTLGTDSLASNNSLSIWEEIQTIRDYFPEISLTTLIKWATINGAEFLGIDKKLGSIEKEKSAQINWINNNGSLNMINTKQ